MRTTHRREQVPDSRANVLWSSAPSPSAPSCSAKKGAWIGLASVILTLNPGPLSSPAPVCQSGIVAEAGSPSSVQIREIIASGKLPVLRWPDFSDYKPHLQSFYESSGYSLAW